MAVVTFCSAPLPVWHKACYPDCFSHQSKTGCARPQNISVPPYSGFSDLLVPTWYPSVSKGIGVELRTWILFQKCKDYQSSYAFVCWLLFCVWLCTKLWQLQTCLWAYPQYFSLCKKVVFLHNSLPEYLRSASWKQLQIPWTAAEIICYLLNMKLLVLLQGS